MLGLVYPGSSKLTFIIVESSMACFQPIGTIREIKVASIELLAVHLLQYTDSSIVTGISAEWSIDFVRD